MKPLIISVSDTGRGQVMQYDDFAKIPIDRASKYYLAQWAELYYGRNHATLQRDFAESLSFFSNQLQSATIQRFQKTKILEDFLLDPSHQCRENPRAFSSSPSARDLHDNGASVQLSDIYAAAGHTFAGRQRDPPADPTGDPWDGG